MWVGDVIHFSSSNRQDMDHGEEGRASHINTTLSEKILSHILNLEKAEKESLPYFRGDIGYIREVGNGRSDARIILSYTSKAEFFRSLAVKLRSSKFPVL